ncbi:hypothetical protein GCM10027271_14740 [Saccharopolyspora gloriosae]
MHQPLGRLNAAETSQLVGDTHRVATETLRPYTTVGAWRRSIVNARRSPHRQAVRLGELDLARSRLQPYNAQQPGDVYRQATGPLHLVCPVKVSNP